MSITLNGTTGVTTSGLTSNGIDDNATSTAITIDASENVGINTSSPNSYYAKKLVVDCGTDGQNGITIKSSTTGAGMFAFADGTSGSDRYRGYINYNHANDSMTLGTAGGAGVLTIDATGAVTMPHQPAFLVKPNTEQSNIALAGNVTVLFQTEIFDQNADFANNTFTAPVSGKYQLNFSLYLKTINDAYQYIYARIQTSNRNYEVEIYPSTIFNSDGRITIGAGFLADMDASDTAFVTVQVPNTGSAQMDIVVYSTFSGYLAC